MDIGIIGLSRSGKTTLFNCLIGSTSASQARGDRADVGVAKVPDPRLQELAKIFRPKRIVPAEVRYLDVPFTPRGLGKTEGFSGKLLDQLGKVDAFLHVVRAFQDPAVPLEQGSIDPHRDFETMNLELAFSDLTILDRRMKRIEESLKGARAAERDALLKEQSLVNRIRQDLEQEKGIRQQSLTPEEVKSLSGYQFLTTKPMLFVLNIGEEDLPRVTELEEELERKYVAPGLKAAVICGKLEEELSQLDEVESTRFRADMQAGEPALHKVLRRSFELLGLISFLTGGPEEVRAWPVPRGIQALKAAGKVHSDMERGFIRAEVVSYQDLAACGGVAEARRRGLLRTEGKSYVVQDGDVINFLFNV